MSSINIFNYFDLAKSEKANNQTDQIVLENLHQALDYLASFDYVNNIANFVDTNQVYHAIYYIGRKLNLTHLLHKIDFNIFLEKKCDQILGHILSYLYKINQKLDFKKVGKIASLTEPIKRPNSNEKSCSIFCYSFFIINKIIARSILFNLKFQSSLGLKSIFQFLNDEQFVLKNLKITQNVFESGEMSILDDIVLNVLLMSKNSDEFKTIWIDELNAVNILLKLAKIKPHGLDDIFLTVINIADDKQIETLNEIKVIALTLIEQFNICVADFTSESLVRKKRQVVEDFNIKIVEVHCIKYKAESIVSMISIFDSLYRLAINDKTRLDLYFEYNLKTNLKCILFMGNPYEKKLCLKVLAQLSFNQEISKDMFKDKEFLAILNEVIQAIDKKTIADEFSLKKLCELIHWNLIGKSSREAKIKSREINVYTKKHLVLSYSLESRDLCLKIKSKMEYFGYKISMNMGNDNDNFSMETMAQAVEASYFVLVCVTEKYRQNVFSQVESIYGWSINKPIIPLIFQKGYENVSGWLGNLMKNKLCIDFVDLDFNKSMLELIEQVDLDINLRPDLSSLKPQPEKVEEDIKEEEKMKEIVKEIEKEIDENRSEDGGVKEDETKVEEVEVDEPIDEQELKNYLSKRKKMQKSWLDVDYDDETRLQQQDRDWAKYGEKSGPKYNPETMSEMDVRRWLHSNQIHESIIKYLLPCDGEMLKQIYDMRKRNPGFFDQSLFKINDMTLVSVAKFSACLERLFQENENK